MKTRTIRIQSNLVSISLRTLRSYSPLQLKDYAEPNKPTLLSLHFPDAKVTITRMAAFSKTRAQDS